MCQELGDESLGMTAPWSRKGNAVGGLRWWTGCHTSTAGGMERAVINAAAIGKSCNACEEIRLAIQQVGPLPLAAILDHTHCLGNQDADV